jgi:uncharacterized protein YkwD
MSITRPLPARFLLVLLGVVLALTAPPAVARAATVTTASTGTTASLETYAEQLLAAAHDGARRVQGGTSVVSAGTTELIWSSELATLARQSSDRLAQLGALDHDPAIREALCCSSRFSNNIGVSSTSGATAADIRRATTRLVELWLGSAGHRDNLLDPVVTHIGIGVHLDRDGRLWATAVFQERPISTASTATQPADSGAWCPTTAPSGRFPDVDNVHTPAVECLAALGIIQGVSEDRFDPAGTVTRGQLAMLLDRSVAWLGTTRPASLPGVFIDVSSGMVSGPAIERLAGAGIVLGRPDGRFIAGAPVTRGQIAAQLEATRRALHGEVEVGPRERFRDVPTSRRFARAIDAGANAGLLAGGDDGRFEPDSPLRRDQAASLIARFLELELR